METFVCVCNRSRETTGGCRCYEVSSPEVKFPAEVKRDRKSKCATSTSHRQMYMKRTITLLINSVAVPSKNEKRANGTSSRKLGLHVAMFPAASRVLRHRVCQNMMRAKASLGRSLLGIGRIECSIVVMHPEFWAPAQSCTLGERPAVA